MFDDQSWGHASKAPRAGLSVVKRGKAIEQSEAEKIETA